jgi:dihydropteroate synthase type 2
LRGIAALKSAFDLPVLVSVSRKSFLRTLTGRKPREAGAASLAAELFAAGMGADFIRTHDPGALRDALAVTAVLDGAAHGA